MTEKSIFDLDPDQLDRLLSIGADADKEQSSNEQEAQADQERVAPEGGSALSGPPQSGDPTASLSSVVERPGGWMGQYKLLSVLGEGGMGIVYLAEQERPIKRRVALKVIKPGMDSKRVLARFDAERQALALLDHPNIAHVYDAGMTETGRPYFVMEHVKGLPVTEHCDHYKLTIEQRLRLFQQICQAVQHAHQKGIIHRDIKPSNILVTIHEDQAIPKIIDFGVAKAILQPLTDRTLYTEQGQLFGTAEYMSPEQADMASEDIDTRSDIYSLGVLLYELLTGVLPFASETLHGGGIEQIRKVICETDPKTPSTRLTRLGEEAQKVAENRRTEIGTLAKRLHRELEWIPLKAMRKERSERYRSASELSDDVENYLKGAPLIAGPPTPGYRLSKFLRRHKALVGGVAAVLVVSVIGTIVSVTFAMGQAKETAKNRTLAKFLNNDILIPLGDNESFKPNSIREVFDTASEKLTSEFADHPLLEASLRYSFGRIYGWQFLDSETAIKNFKRAVELKKRATGIPPFGYMNYLGLSCTTAGRYSEAVAIFSEMIESIEQNRKQEGKEPGGDFYYAIKSHLGNTWRFMGRYEEAEPYIREAPLHPWWEKGHWREHVYRGRVAALLKDQGHYKEAEQLYNELLSNRRSFQDEVDWRDWVIMKELGILHMLQGNLEKAAPLLEKAWEGIQEELGHEHGRIVPVGFALAVLRTKQGDDDKAESLFDEVLNNMQIRLNEDHPKLLRAKSHLGVLYREQGRHNEAEKLLNKLRQTQSEKLGPDHPHTLESMQELAVLYKEQGHYNKAEPLLKEAIEGRRLKLGDTHPHTIESWHTLIDLYEAWNKPEKAKEWRAKLPQIGTAEQ